MADFDKAIQKVLRHEGVKFLEVDGHLVPDPEHTGYAHHVDDPGGMTNYGITRVAARANGYKGSMKEIPYDIVLRIYVRKYWVRVGADKIVDQEIAEELFDTAVNCGVSVAVAFLQRTLNVLNAKERRYLDLKVDSRFGPKTERTLRQCLEIAPWYKLCVLRALDSLQCVRYIDLAERHVKFESFMAGWLRTRVGGHE